MTTLRSLTLNEWRLAASEAFGPLDISAPRPEAFQAVVRTVEAGGVTLFDLTTHSHVVEKRPESISRSAQAFGKLSLQLEGECLVTQDGRSCVLREGDLAFYLTQRPYSLEYSDTQHSMVVQFPLSFVHMAPEDVEEITATRITHDSGLGRVAVPLFEQLAMNFEVLDGPHTGSLMRSALDMLVTVLSSELHRPPGASAALYRQATDYIDSHLSDPDLRPRTIADALYVSVRHLHTQFAANGHTVASYIRTQRLEKIRRDLADPLCAEDTIQTIGGRYGLPEASHVSRVFRAEFGQSPSKFRQVALAGS